MSYFVPGLSYLSILLLIFALFARLFIKIVLDWTKL